MATTGPKLPGQDPQARIWRFADCEFDEVRHELRVRGSIANLEAKPLEVLHQLLLHAGEVVRKEDLLETVWPGVVVVDASLATAVSKLRKVLGEEDAIKTVPKLGYRLAVPVHCETKDYESNISQQSSRDEILSPLGSPQTTWWKTFLNQRVAVWGIFAAVLVGLSALLLSAFRPISKVAPVPGAVAILPFQNASSNPGLDYLRLALPDEVANTLTAARSLELRPITATSRYSGQSPDLRMAARELSVSRIVTGHYVLAGDQLQITMEAVDTDANRVLWHDTLNVPANDLLSLQAQVAALSRKKLADALGVTEFVSDVPPPKNAEAYEMYLRTTAMEWDTASNQEAINLLRRSVALDPSYGPAWGQLSLRYYNVSRFGGGGPDMMQLSDAAAEKQLALEPDSPDPVAELTIHRTERGDLAKAYEQAEELVRRRPDNPNNHHVLSYVLRYAGSIDESGRQCDLVVMLAYKFVWGSCSSTWMQLGNYQKARESLRKDLSSEYSKAHAIEIYLRQGRIQEALNIPAPKVSGWESYKMVLACAGHASESEIKSLAAKVAIDDDPEINYFFAGHLAYCGLKNESVRFLKLAVDGNYCSYPTVDRDPLFDRIRTSPEFARVHTSAMACHERFIAAVKEKKDLADGRRVREVAPSPKNFN